MFKKPYKLVQENKILHNIILNTRLYILQWIINITISYFVY